MSDFITCPRCHEEYVLLGTAGRGNCPKCGAPNVADRLKGQESRGGGLFIGRMTVDPLTKELRPWRESDEIDDPKSERFKTIDEARHRSPVYWLVNIAVVLVFGYFMAVGMGSGGEVIGSILFGALFAWIAWAMLHGVFGTSLKGWRRRHRNKIN
jgi:hypothetical protein